jgi:carnitine O-palmitoyltransferase 1
MHCVPLCRHLFALYVVSQGTGLKSAFLVDALKEPWRLSTSQQPQQQTTIWNPSGKDSHLVSYGGGFGPVTDDGYGVSYMVAGENLLFFNISCKRACPTTDCTKCVFK